VHKISLRRAVAEVTSDDDIRKIARGLVDGAFDDDGKPRMDAINALVKLLPHIPSSQALERAKVLAAGSVEEQARMALDALLAHVIEDGTPEAAAAFLDGMAKWAAAAKSMADAPTSNATDRITINVMQHPDTVSTTATVTTEPRTDEVKK
jgi:hypothetical protein